MKCVVAMICGTAIGGNFSFLNITYKFKNKIPTEEEITELVTKVCDYVGVSEASVLNIIPIQDEEKSDVKDEEEWKDEC